jgi:hypothetical protein
VVEQPPSAIIVVLVAASTPALNVALPVKTDHASAITNNIAPTFFVSFDLNTVI